MPWIACLALLMIFMLVASVVGAEINFRRAVERRDRLMAHRRRAAHS